MALGWGGAAEPGMVPGYGRARPLALTQGSLGPCNTLTWVTSFITALFLLRCCPVCRHLSLLTLFSKAEIIRCTSRQRYCSCRCSVTVVVVVVVVVVCSCCVVVTV